MTDLNTIYAPDNSFHIENEMGVVLLGACYDGAAACYRVAIDEAIWNAVADIFAARTLFLHNHSSIRAVAALVDAHLKATGH